MPLPGKLEEKWFCCFCGDGPWSSFIDGCHNGFICDHRRCGCCRVETHRVLRSERGPSLSTWSEDAALRNNGLSEPHLQHPFFPGETNVHFALQGLAEPHGFAEPLPQASWTTEPHPGSTNAYTPAIPLYEFQTSDRLTGLEPFHHDFPQPSCQAPTAFAWDLFDTYPTTFPVPADHSLESAWPVDPLSVPSEPWLSTLDPSQPILGCFPPESSLPTLDQSHASNSSFVTILPPTNQPQPSNHPGLAQTPKQVPITPESPNPKDSQDRGLLACPFWKKDPHSTWSASRGGQACCTGHKRIRDVKQHIYRHHTPAATQTPSRKSRKTETVERLTEHQILQLRQYSKRNSGEQAQWFAIWDILFPDLKLSRPASPYVKDLEGEMADYRVSCLGRDIELGTIPLLSPISPSPIPLVQYSPDTSTDTAVWETEVSFKVDDDDGFFQQYGAFGSRFEYLDTKSHSTALDVPGLDGDTTGFWNSHSGPVQYSYQIGSEQFIHSVSCQASKS